jgi:hypothetical protein
MSAETRIIILYGIIVSAAIAALLTFSVRPKCKPVEHWHYANCNRIAQYCAVG